VGTLSRVTANVKKTAIKHAVRCGGDRIHLAGPTIVLVRDAELVEKAHPKASNKATVEAQLKGRVFECTCSSAGMARDVIYKELPRVLANFPHLTLPSAILASKIYLEAQRHWRQRRESWRA